MARIDDEHWNAIAIFLNQIEPSGDPHRLQEAMRENWTDVIDKPTMVRAAKLKRLGDLRKGRDDQDATRAQLDQEITDLERDTGGRTP